jgi:hypothetical protein
MQHGEVMRDGVVGQAEHHAVERPRCREFGGILLEQIDVGPAILRTQRTGLIEHAGRDVDAINGAGRSDRRL